MLNFMFKPKNQRFGFFIGYMMYHFLCLTVLKCWRKMAGTKKLKISIERERGGQKFKLHMQNCGTFSNFHHLKIYEK